MKKIISLFIPVLLVAGFTVAQVGANSVELGSAMLLVNHTKQSVEQTLGRASFIDLDHNAWYYPMSRSTAWFEVSFDGAGRASKTKIVSAPRGIYTAGVHALPTTETRASTDRYAVAFFGESCALVVSFDSEEQQTWPVVFTPIAPDGTVRESIRAEIPPGHSETRVDVDSRLLGDWREPGILRVDLPPSIVLKSAARYECLRGDRLISTRDFPAPFARLERGTWVYHVHAGDHIATINGGDAPTRLEACETAVAEWPCSPTLSDPLGPQRAAFLWNIERDGYLHVRASAPAALVWITETPGIERDFHVHSAIQFEGVAK